jgi:uncharacterized membrane protein YfhO
VYENLAFKPRAWIDSGAPAEVADWTPNRIVVRAQGPGLLTLSEINYPGWLVSIDDAAAPLETVDEGLRGVRLSDGPHTVVFDFHPIVVYLGLTLTGFGLLGLLAVLRWAR